MRYRKKGLPVAEGGPIILNPNLSASRWNDATENSWKENKFKSAPLVRGILATGFWKENGVSFVNVLLMEPTVNSYRYTDTLKVWISSSSSDKKNIRNIVPQRQRQATPLWQSENFD